VISIARSRNNLAGIMDDGRSLTQHDLQLWAFRVLLTFRNTLALIQAGHGIANQPLSPGVVLGIIRLIGEAGNAC
jgi:hypothetical protein